MALAYEKMHQFYKEVDSWISNELSSAPEGLSHGWFVSNLEFYDLQDSLSDGTLIAMGLSVAVAFSVMLLTTWNIIISLYAIISIAGTIFVTVGSLVLLGWELNVLESVTISVAVGLSVDFAVHYGVAYRLAPDADREGKVIFSLSRMGSAIAMAALTTFVAASSVPPRSTRTPPLRVISAEKPRFSKVSFTHAAALAVKPEGESMASRAAERSQA